MNLNVIKNMKFYKFILNQKARRIFDDNIIKNINNKDIKFNSSSSCMIKNSDGDGYIMNVRYVNYNIDNNGGYHDCSDHIITMNKRVDLDNNFNIIKEEFCDFNFDGRRYIGIEDIRIINTINNIKFIGTGYHMNETIGIVEGDYDNINNITELKQDFKNTSCEKNWVYIDSNRIIYEWYPLRIGIINNNNLTINEEHNMPKIFRYIRGSTCGFDHNNEYWFVVHLVSYDSPRDYYHLVVVFDKNMNLLRYTAPFKFEGEPIEYCLSICINDNKVYINYSTWDRTTRIGMYDLDYIESIMYHNK
jgi:hypothetical protein